MVRRGAMAGGADEKGRRWGEIRGEDARKEIREEEEDIKCGAMQAVEKEKERPGRMNTRV